MTTTKHQVEIECQGFNMTKEQMATKQTASILDLNNTEQK